jgi:hypothetical protein
METAKVRPTVTERDLYAAEQITLKMAADYLGKGFSEHRCRLLARMGKIGDQVTETRVIVQRDKLIRYKTGAEDYEQRYKIAAKVLKDEGLTDLAAELALTFIRLADKRGDE